MKILFRFAGKYQCPYCNTVVELDEDDVKSWNNEVFYYTCPTCYKTPHIKGNNIWCPFDITGKKAKHV